ncbi:MetQ/NlpA family ABC transporter substrate-binding protein [Bavariicoccus seileri]|uniref:MetQ/NlpA family ABC transporter substrate-binding protein n=1 Tax=Bavariicoccus seileri TaxID=549685 RepID=UPI0003B3DA67|nr:MetQ/NlpA family ABC transporter substrate-binding protein [Bavariicoccus seileri]
MTFNKLIKGFLLTAATISLAACGNNANDSDNADKEPEVIKVVASPAPHAEILEQVKPILEEEGYDLEINIVNDYNTPNQLVVDGGADANFFQHTPYLDTWNEDHGTDLVGVGNVHIEPMAVYSQKYDSLEDLPENATVYASTNPAEVGRFLGFFVNAGLITLKEGTDPVKAQLEDIEDNPKDITIETSIAPELLVQTYQAGEGDAVIINSNFAIDAGLSPIEDSIALEDQDSPYANLIAVRPDEKDDPKIKALIEAVQSETVKKYIEDNYKDGSVIPAF